MEEDHSCETNCKEEELPWFPELLLKLVFLSIIALMSTFVNIVLIYLSYRTKSLVSNTKLFVISLSVSHMLGSVLVIPIWLVTRVLRDVASEPPFCDIASFVWFLMTLSSFYSLSAISLDRYFIIAHPMRYPIQATTKKKLLALVVIWATCILFACAPIFGWGKYEFQPGAIPICGLNWKHSLSYSIIFIILGFIVPIFVDVVTCGRILSIARRQSREIEARKGSFTSSASFCSNDSAISHAKGRKLKHRLHSLRFIFAGTGCFLVCWVPYLVANIWLVFTDPKEETGTMPYLLEFSVMFVALLNGLVNPVVIMATHRDYKRQLKKILYENFGFYKDGVLEDRSDFDSSLVRRSDIKNLHQIFQKLNACSSGALGSKDNLSGCVSTGSHTQPPTAGAHTKSSFMTKPEMTNQPLSGVMDIPGLVIK